MNIYFVSSFLTAVTPALPPNLANEWFEYDVTEEAQSGSQASQPKPGYVPQCITFTSVLHLALCGQVMSVPARKNEPGSHHQCSGVELKSTSW